MQYLRRLMALLLCILLCIPTLASSAALLPDAEANLVLTGDIMCLAGQLSAAKVNGGWDFDYAFSGISPILQGADFAIGNLEVPLAGADRGVTAYHQEGDPILNAPDEFADAVAAAGFDMVVTANNHAFDMGDTGRERTLSGGQV